MKSFIIVAACLIAAISAYPDISGTEDLNHQQFFNPQENVKERQFDTYGAPDAPVITNGNSFDTTYTSYQPTGQDSTSYGSYQATGQDATYFPAGSSNIGVGFGVNGDLGYGNQGGITLNKGGLGGFFMNFLVGIFVVLGLTQLFQGGSALLGYNPLEDVKNWFANDGARSINPQTIALTLNKIEEFAKKFE